MVAKAKRVRKCRKIYFWNIYRGRMKLKKFHIMLKLKKYLVENLKLKKSHISN